MRSGTDADADTDAVRPRSVLSVRMKH
jgi:hypothetical protein